jgi:F-type H+-transporting ATPase subunit b
MELVTPAIGLIFWTTVTFIILLVLLRKLAWKPILNAVKSRELSIEEALQSAEKARKEMENLTADNERILREARGEREQILKEAREMKDGILNEAREAAKKETEKMLQIARESIQNEKMAAITDLRNSVGQLSLEIASKILKSEINTPEKHNALIEEMVNNANLN